MKKALSLLIAVFLITSLFMIGVNADGEGVIREGDNGGNWVVSEDGSTYVCPDRVEWPSFGVYGLGNTTEKVSISMTYTVGFRADEATSRGGDGGFLFAVSDTNGDGIIDENGDYYYLVDVTCAEDGAKLGIERNEGKWGDWACMESTGFAGGESFTLLAIYDPEIHEIYIYIDGELFVEYEDTQAPLSGTGYALCSKITNSEYTNVVVKTGADVTFPDQEPDTPDDPGDTPDDPGDTPDDPGKTDDPADPGKTDDPADPGKTDTNTDGKTVGATDEKKDDEKKTNILPIILIVAACVVAAVVVVVIVVLSKKKKPV